MNIRTRIRLGEPHPHMGPLISSYQDGLTDPPETETVERHLLECERCRDFFGGLQQVREAIEDLPDFKDDSDHTDTQFQAILNRTVYKGKQSKPPAERGLKKLISNRKRHRQEVQEPTEATESKTPVAAKKRTKSKAS